MSLAISIGCGIAVQNVAFSQENRGTMDQQMACTPDVWRLCGAQIPDELKKRDLTQPNGPHESVQKEILRLYKSSPELSILFELMTDFDEGLQEWRYRHIKLVERTIGAKKGTGGSPGVPFLKESLFKPIFHDLWAIRHRM